MKRISKYAEFSPDEWGLVNDIFLEFVDEFQAEYITSDGSIEDCERLFIEKVYDSEFGIFWSKYEYTAYYGRQCKCFKIFANIQPENGINKKIKDFLQGSILPRIEKVGITPMLKESFLNHKVVLTITCIRY